MAALNHLFYVFLGLLPSIIWLCLFLRKDAHPESNRMILKIFFYGILSTVPVILIGLGFFKITSGFFAPLMLVSILNIFIGVALIEEIFKYLAVRQGVLFSSELDEPIDVMLYMIIAGLGFAALENILILSRVHPFLELPELFLLIALRFTGATFLHALCSGLIGYFLALSFFETKKRTKLFLTGLGIATLLHGFYNFSIMKIGGWLAFLIIVFILIGLAIFVIFGFKRLKKLKSICKI